MGGKTKLEELKKSVAEAGKEIRRKHPGADIKEAKEFLRQAATALEKDALDEALKLAQQARLAACPTTSYLLDKARRSVAQAEEAYQAQKYDEALHLYRQASQEYEAAQQLAISRGEKETAQAIDEALKAITENVTNISFEKDVATVNSLVKRSNELIQEADRFFRSRSFEQAIENYQHAQEILSQALPLAQNRRLEVQSQIQESLKSLERSLQLSYLKKGEELIEKGQTEKDFEETLKYLEGIKAPEEEKEELRRRGQRRLLRVRLDQGREKMKEAERLYREKRYTDAIETYSRAREYLSQLSGQAASFELLEEKSEADRLIAASVDNIQLLRKELTGVGRVGRGITPVSEVARSEVTLAERAMFDPRELLQEKYALVELLGEGGFAWVYKARRRDSGEEVALKLFKSMDETARSSFIREVEAWAKLEHPNIVRRRAWDIRPPFIEMELATSSLAKLTKPVSTLDACRYAFEVCRALNHAHDKRIYHRDLKPSNILLFGERVKVSDWGLARVVGHTMGFSLGMLGTVYYMAPEQFRGEETDARTDIYQVGVVLYELLSGRRPFEEMSEEAIMHKVLNETPPPLSALNPEATKVELLVMRCLEKEREKRFQTVRELQLALADLLKEKYGVKLEFSRREEKARWLSELLLVHLKIQELPNSLSYAYKLAEETRDGDIFSLCEELKVRIRDGIKLSEERLYEIEALLRKFI